MPFLDSTERVSDLCGPVEQELNRRHMGVRKQPGLPAARIEFLRKWPPRLRLLFVLTMAVCGGAGCQHFPPDFFPLGIYTAGNVSQLPILRQAGFNVVAGPAERSFLNAAQAAGLKVLASPGTSAGPQFNAAVVRSAIRQFDAHPAVWGWHLVDEPDLNRITPTDVVQAHRYFKSLRPRKPTALVIYAGYNALDYGHITDVLLLDRYPIPWLPLADFGQQVALARLALGKQKPLFAILQAFDWSYHPALVPGEKNLRPPTYTELRCMTYCALAQQANGLFYYTFDDGKWKITEHPETWNAVQNVVKEVHDRLPLFQAQHLWWPLRRRFEDRTRRFNQALGSSVTSVCLRVRKGNASVPPGEYVLCVNNTDWPHVYSFELPHPMEGDLPVLGEQRRVSLEHNWLKDKFTPYAVHVYGPLLPRHPQQPTGASSGADNGHKRKSSVALVGGP